MTAARSVIERRRPWAWRRRWFVSIVTPAFGVEAWCRTRRQAEGLVNVYEGRRTQDAPDIAEILARLDPGVVEASVTAAGRGHTTDRSDPRLGHGVDQEPVEQHDVYLVLSDEERAKGFVRPVRRSYVHLVCGAVTTMSLPIAETYAREPGFYGSTYCCTCRRHLPVGRDGEFVWDDGSGQRVGT